jgi:hypothetical protein
MILNIFAGSILLLPFCASLLLGTAYFVNSTNSWVYYVMLAGAMLAILNIVIQVFMMRWLLIEMLAPLAQLLGVEMETEMEEVEVEDDFSVILGAIWLFISHASVIILLFLLQMPIVGFFAAFGYAVFLLGEWTMHEKLKQ